MTLYVLIAADVGDPLAALMRVSTFKHPLRIPSCGTFLYKSMKDAEAARKNLEENLVPLKPTTYTLTYHCKQKFKDALLYL
jgi:hypothetical protein